MRDSLLLSRLQRKVKERETALSSFSSRFSFLRREEKTAFAHFYSSFDDREGGADFSLTTFSSKYFSTSIKDDNGRQLDKKRSKGKQRIPLQSMTL